MMLECAGLSNTTEKIKVLEIGCANGKDAIQFLTDCTKYEITGIDLKDSDLKQANFKFVKCDASALPFKDKEFDLVISIGTLEHIEPIEKLSQVIKEIDRVGKSHVNVVPSVSTFIEPHTVSPFWPTSAHRNMVDKYSKDILLKLNFFSDHTWSKFEGFRDADVRRAWYIFPFFVNTVIYKKQELQI
jgi:ubiquinone/menaquinone biosynthesis C-methylase UbiE